MFEKLKLIITIKELIKLLNKNFDIAEKNIQDSSKELKEDIETLDEKVDGININLTKQIDDLEQDVNDKYNELVRDIDDLTDVVEEDRVDSENRDIALGERIDNLDSTTGNLQAKIEDLETDLTTYKGTNDKAVSDLSQTVQNNYTTLDTKIDTTAQTINQRITDVADELNQTIEENVVALQQEDTALQNQINTHSQQITQEISDRQTADSNLQTQITANTTDISDLTQVVQDDYNELKDLIDQEIEDREGADTTLQNQINTHSQTLTAHDTRITNNTNAITKEIGDRQSADENLQEQIDGITAGADVRDIVGTYADLQAYDKTTLGDNDIIKVLNDETKENASTYYRFSITAQDFTYIGKEGPFYTKSETDSLLNDKQDTISDLDQIRTNAQTGANLVTQVGTNTTDIGDLKLNKADKSELPTKLSDLQDDITNNLGSELNYENSTLELLNSTGETLSSVTIKSTPDLDNKTINLNSDSQLQSVGSILQSGGYQKYWQGTKAEYEAIQVKDPDTLYEVLDDIVDIVTEIPTATSTDIGLVKPDNTTITVDDTGALSVKNLYANVNLNNINNAYDFAIYSVTYGGGESGYTKYKNKRLEQWGVTNASASGESEITMHVPFKDMNYSVFIEMRETGDFFHYAIPSGVQKFKVRVKGANGNFYGARFQWRSYGFYE